MIQYDFFYPAKKKYLNVPCPCSSQILAFYFPPNPWEGLTMMLCSKGNKCNNIYKGGNLIKINWCRNISFSTKLKTNFIKKVDLLIYNFHYISSGVIKQLTYKKKKKTQTISQSWKLHKIILTKKNYKFVHWVIISVNLFDEAVEGMCTVQTVNKGRVMVWPFFWPTMDLSEI